MLNQIKNVLLIGASSIILAACGGGNSASSGGGSNSGGTNVSPPTNAAPIASISASDTAPNEGRKSTLDATASSDADGDTLTYSWTQLSGPDAILSAPTASITDISVPNLTADTSARIQLQVSDGTTTSSSEITLNFTNLVQLPEADFTVIEEKTLSYPNRVAAIPTDFYVFETLNYLVYESGGQFIWDQFGYDANDNLEIYQEQRIISDSANIVSGLDIFRPFNPGFAALGSDRVTFFDPIFEPSERFSIDAEQPCSLVAGHQVASAYDPEEMVIGLRNGGAMLVNLEMNSDGATGISTVLQNFGGTASFCAMEISYFKILAFDENTNTVTHYRINQDSEGKITDLSEVSSITLNLDLPAGSNVEFVGSVGNLVSAPGMALVFSDGETDGNHRLVVVTNGLGGGFTQETYSWDYGAPTSIFKRVFDNDLIDSFVISTKDSPHAVVFKSGNISDLRPYLPLSGPTYLDLGVGHGAISTFKSQFSEGIIVPNSDENLVKVLLHP